ncbi:flagellar basal body rod protein FlgB [Planctomycetes bacterium Pan216]|uniref:Flagellar basal body rod protein FlgB n=1 Tax=Kolteria novifilia TaxID=2527975 RepID=A0A518B564_9BACT|nr:flagellar basal body rod protein FlgB [Planctomycetes bacterium Pan216]
MSLLNLLNTNATSMLEHVVAFTGDRMKVIASNIANIDTPQYRMRDLDAKSFDRELAGALKRSERVNANLPMVDLPSVDQVASFEASADSPDAQKLRGIVFHDDNDRSVEKLMVAMQRNADRNSQAANLLRNQVRLLRSIIAEQVNT